MLKVIAYGLFLYPLLSILGFIYSTTVAEFHSFSCSLHYCRDFSHFLLRKLFSKKLNKCLINFKQLFNFAPPILENEL